VTFGELHSLVVRKKIKYFLYKKNIY
jgi:hypothetical protein